MKNKALFKPLQPLSALNSIQYQPLKISTNEEKKALFTFWLKPCSWIFSLNFVADRFLYILASKCNKKNINHKSIYLHKKSILCISIQQKKTKDNNENMEGNTIIFHQKPNQ